MLRRASLPSCGFLLSWLLAVMVGCAVDNPGKWPAERVAAHLAQRLEITEVTLTPTETGFSGTGLRADGETLTLTITLAPEASEFRWDVKGDRGFVEEGSYGLVSPAG